MEASSPTGTGLQAYAEITAPRLAEVAVRLTCERLLAHPLSTGVPTDPEDRHLVEQGDRMNRIVGLAIGATLVVASQAYSCCLFSCCKGKGYAAPVAAPVVVAAPAAAAPAAPAVQYVEQKC